MKCEAFEEHITDYLEGTLPPGLYEAAEAHRAACADCQSLTAMVAQIIDTCHALPKLDPSPDLVSKVLQKTYHKDTPWTVIKNRFRGLWQPVLWPKVAVGTALMIGFLSLSVNFLSSRDGYGPGHWLKKADLLTHQIVSQGLKLYDRKNQWQAQLKFFGASLLNRMEYHWGEANEELRQEPAPHKKSEPTPPEPKKDPNKQGKGRLPRKESRIV